MSKILIQAYLNEIDRLKKYSGSSTESIISEAFKDLLKAWSKQQSLIFINQHEFETTQKTRVVPDGTILHDMRVPLGYWEAKDTDDNLDEEIRKKLSKGYPQDNIIFENSVVAVLIQNRHEVMRCKMADVNGLDRLVTLFFSYERREIAEFRKAVDQFKTDLPAVLAALRDKIDNAYNTNEIFREAAATFLIHAKKTINPAVSDADVREMLIQHILTEEIFAHVFNDSDFHRENNIAKALYALEAKFFIGAVKKDTLHALEPYYAAIRANAAQITDHIEKQTFLKLIYENFYKVYNPKAADRLGVVYTPNEIVRFMIEGADWLCQKHFGKALIDQNVEILDPATGTGTFICELLEHFRGQPTKLARKYKEELHANEVAILPYYVANLNIEATYATIAGQYAEFPNLCFVDTLDNIAALGKFSGHQEDLFGAVSGENVERINRQNKRKISVIIGNPPYNANQLNENDNNPNRVYRRIDERIKATYIKQSTAQKTKLYDMYARFFRWASDRLPDDGILSFISNRSFIESRAFDGFRKTISEEFNEIYVVDLGGDVRANPKLSGTKNNVFGIQTGVAISFLVKRKGHTETKIFYVRRPELETADDKLTWLASTTMDGILFDRIKPDEKNNWLHVAANDFGTFIPIASKETKTTKTKAHESSIFKLFSLGVVTARDDWVYDLDRRHLTEKLKYFHGQYSKNVQQWRAAKKKDSKAVPDFDPSIKWTRAVKGYLTDGKEVRFKVSDIRYALYRPYFKQSMYFNKTLNEMQYQLRKIFEGQSTARAILISGVPSAKPFQVIATELVPSYDTLEKTECLARYILSSDGSKVDNLTDWGLERFRVNYPAEGREITKDAIFCYVYGVLHDPTYRKKYAHNLKREFPRIPFYPDFWKWVEWGDRLMALHICYESVEPWPLKRLDAVDVKARAAGVAPRTILKSDQTRGEILLDSETKLSGVPADAWDYKLGNRSALDWVLDQYKEKMPKDPTIREKFDAYLFANYKENVINLLMRVSRVSFETVAITREMLAAQEKLLE